MNKNFIFVLVCTLAVHLTASAQYKQIQKTFTVANQKLAVKLDNIKSSDCIAGPGAISITASGGSGNYSYAWTGPNGFTSTNQDLTGLIGGAYELVVSDGNCSESMSVNVQTTCTSSCTFLVTKDLTNATSCSVANGSINIGITGGSNSFAFEWYLNGGLISTTEDISGLLPGYYELRYKDANNTSCGTRFEAFNITSPFIVNTSVVQNTSCQSPYTGGITTSVTGGSGNYSYQWTLPSGSTVTTQNLSASPAGNYTLLVADLTLGCTITKYASISTSSSLNIATNSISNNSLCAPANGSIDISVTGGTGNYTYSWYNQSTFTFAGATEDLLNARAGQYSLYVTDNVSKCTGYASFTITESLSAPSYTVSGSTNNTNCLPPYNGSVSLEPTGTGPFGVQWIKNQSIVSTQEDPTTLGPGTYGFVLTDLSSGCTVSVTEVSPSAITIIDESTPSASIGNPISTPNTSCTPNGQIQIDVTSTTPHYNLQWTGPNNFTSTDEDISNLIAGDYYLTVNVACNLPPVIDPPTLPVQHNNVTLNLMDFVSDPDNNLDPASLKILEQPISGGIASIDQQLLNINYSGVVFKGNDELKIEACDLLNACTEKIISLAVEFKGELIVHNAVAPASSGDNKFMRISNLPDEVSNKVMVYNRWGDQVFSIDGYDNSLHGKRFEGLSQDGKQLPSGTYFYKIEFADGAKAITGYLSLKW